MTSSNVKNSLRHAVDELERARDEIKVGVHLLSLDAKKEWDSLEARLHSLDGELRAKGESASEASAERIREVAKTLRQFVEKNVRNLEQRT